MASLSHPLRLKAVREAQVVDPAHRMPLTRLARLAAELADTPIALITAVDECRQNFVAQFGLPTRLAAEGGISIDYSMCRYAVASGRPLIVDSLADDPVFRSHPALTDLGIAAYAGIPLITSDGQAIGSLCVMDVVERDWSDDVLARLALLADVVTDELQLRSLEPAEAVGQ